MINKTIDIVSILTFSVSCIILESLTISKIIAYIFAYGISSFFGMACIWAKHNNNKRILHHN